MKINKNYLNLQESYLFSDIAKRIKDYDESHPGNHIIRLGIGDVTMPIYPAVIDAMHVAVTEMGIKESFHGYGPEQGYAFLREAIQADYTKYGVSLEANEVFVSDGAKSDIANILDLFDQDNVVLVPNPVYPVYVDTNIMHGREICYMNGNKENDFLPMPDASQKADIIYICSPNNPTGSVYTKAQLKEWVDYANAQNAVILFDAAYACFIQDPELPRSIYEIEGSKTCAIEICSYSKTAGFTGVRCGYTVVPHALVFDGAELNKFWLRRQTTKFNGVSYVVQKGALALYTLEGQAQIKETVAIYEENAKIMKETFSELGIYYTGGDHSPYIWFECPDGKDSWTFFDDLLNNTEIVGTPGVGFGQNGEGYFRLTAFNTKENTIEAMNRLRKWLAK